MPSGRAPELLKCVHYTCRIVHYTRRIAPFRLRFIRIALAKLASYSSVCKKYTVYTPLQRKQWLIISTLPISAHTCKYTFFVVKTHLFAETTSHNQATRKKKYMTKRPLYRIFTPQREAKDDKGVFNETYLWNKYHAISRR